jgi:DNA-binding MarR family transcriptional regulator
MFKQSIKQYLADVLGSDAISHWTQPVLNKLPYFLQDAYAFEQLQIAGVTVILAIPKSLARPYLRDVRKQLTQAGKLLGLPIIFCTEALASYERRNLIEQKMPFIVPGNQMYLPELGIDLREYFLNASKKQKLKLSPATQAMLIWSLLNTPTMDRWYPGDVGATLHYTNMTVSRAAQELVEAELAEIVQNGRIKWLQMTQSPADTWEKAVPYLRSPVKRVLWTDERFARLGYDNRLAGLSALSSYTMLTAPQDVCYAMTAEQWRENLKAGAKELPEPESGSCLVELWSYNTAIWHPSQTVDRLSLWLSLADSADERVQLARAELLEKIRW